MKALRKMTAVSLAAIMLVQPMIAMAEEKLTVDTALSWAVSNSSDLRNLTSNVDDLDKSIDQMEDALDYTSDYAEVLKLAINIMESEQQILLIGGNERATKEGLRIAIIQLFASIVAAENGLVLYDQNLELMEREMKISDVKYSLGMVSKLEHTTAENNLKKSRANRETQNAAINEAYASLNKMLNRSFVKYWDLELDLPKYTEVANKASSYSGYAETINTKIKQKQSALDVAEYKLKMYDSAVNTEEEKEDLETAVENAELDLYDARRDLEKNIQSSYNDIKDIETRHSTALLALEDLENQMPVKQKQFEIGQITRLELDKLIYQIAAQKETIRSLEVDHEIAVIKINNPVSL
jgi:outer membrane protein TolC